MLRTTDAVTQELRHLVDATSGCWSSILGMTVGAYVVLRSMARRWRANEEDLPSPYGPAVVGSARRLNDQLECGAMTLADAVAVAMFVGVIAYARARWRRLRFRLLRSDRRQRPARQRNCGRRIDHSIGPVWEADHGWLIYVLVIWWTGFPTAFASAMTTLFVPLMLALTGIVLRGTSFAFRKYAERSHRPDCSGRSSPDHRSSLRSSSKGWRVPSPRVGCPRADTGIRSVRGSIRPRWSVGAWP